LQTKNFIVQLLSVSPHLVFKNEQNLVTVRDCSYIHAGLHLGKGGPVQGDNESVMRCNRNHAASLLPVGCSPSYKCFGFGFFLNSYRMKE